MSTVEGTHGIPISQKQKLGMVWSLVALEGLGDGGGGCPLRA